jgi:hypothetical protein
MLYDLAKLPLQSVLRPIADAAAALARLDERIARSPVGEGWIERSHFADAAASLWIDGELVHLEDLVLHDAGSDIRTPTHELISPATCCAPAAGLFRSRQAGQCALTVYAACAARVALPPTSSRLVLATRRLAEVRQGRMPRTPQSECCREGGRHVRSADRGACGDRCGARPFGSGAGGGKIRHA